jgi:peptide deformylase
MILPVYTYGAQILRERTQRVQSDSEEIQRLIDDMIETMHGASGVGLAAPQVGRSERLFVIDLRAAEEELVDYEEADESETALQSIVPLVFINPELELLEGARVDFEEGCLSVPELREEVERPEAVRIQFHDRFFQARELEVDGLLARVIQHEFDHLDGVLFVDHLSPLKRRLIRRRLREMARGEVTADYPIITPIDKKWQTSGSIN